MSSLLALAAFLVVLWLVLVTIAHVSAFVVHLLLIVAVIAFVVWLLDRL
jgi:hypothetical protein